MKSQIQRKLEVPQTKTVSSLESHRLYPWCRFSTTQTPPLLCQPAMRRSRSGVWESSCVLWSRSQSRSHFKHCHPQQLSTNQYSQEQSLLYLNCLFLILFGIRASQSIGQKTKMTRYYTVWIFFYYWWYMYAVLMITFHMGSGTCT